MVLRHGRLICMLRLPDMFGRAQLGGLGDEFRFGKKRQLQPTNEKVCAAKKDRGLPRRKLCSMLDRFGSLFPFFASSRIWSCLATSRFGSFLASRAEGLEDLEAPV